LIVKRSAPWKTAEPFSCASEDAEKLSVFEEHRGRCVLDPTNFGKWTASHEYPGKTLLLSIAGGIDVGIISGSGTISMATLDLSCNINTESGFTK
jgi:hypothetical protein